MPGAGKSTLLAGLPAAPGLPVLDSEAYRAPCSRLLPGLPYAWYRPLVHLWHRLAVLLAALSDAARRWWCTCRPPTSGPAPRWPGWPALTGRSAHLLWLHVDPAEARRGQLARGRVVPEAVVRRARRAGRAAPARLAPARPAAGVPPGWAAVTVLDRPRRPRRRCPGSRCGPAALPWRRHAGEVGDSPRGREGTARWRDQH